MHADPSTLGPVDVGPSPTGIPASCPFSNGDFALVFSSGNAVFHDTTNANGDWGGETFTGPATWTLDGTPLYQGHATLWGGGGNNVQGQNENGFTLSFKGAGVSDSSQTLSVHVSGGSATPAHSTTSTANRLHVDIVCG